VKPPHVFVAVGAPEKKDVALRRVARCVLLAAACASAACGGLPAGPSDSRPVGGLTPVPSTAEWAAAAPEAEGLDSGRLAMLVGRIRGGAYRSITSLLVLRNGRLVVEEYFNGVAASTPHTMQSVSKSVTSLLAGIAIDQGRLGLDDRVVALLRSYEPMANLDGRKEALTVRDLLTMRTGFDWSESAYAGSPLQRMNECRCDWLRFVLDWPMREPPGTRFEYVSGGVILLGGVIGAAVGERIDRFADRVLFGPLETQGAYWYRGLPDDLPHTGGGLYLRPRDMAKLGQLVLDEGRWHGKPIVSPRWILESTTRTVTTSRSFGAHHADYGYLWWVTSPSDIVTASGALGQWIFVSPRERLVVTATGNNDNGFQSSAVDFFYSDILSSVR
jgi:CubicO group peptidase (beta-lactamase class C family)